MAGFIRYETVPVELLVGASAACKPIVTTLTAGENLPLTPVRALGFDGAVAVTSNGPIDGTFSLTYHLIKAAGLEKCSGATATQLPTGCDNFYCETGSSKDFVLQRSFVAGDRITLKVLDTPLFTKGIANTFTLAVEPNAIITATLAGNYYDCGMPVKGGALEAKAAKPGGADLSVAHGSNATATTAGVGFSCKPFTASYEASRGFNPIYVIGNLEPEFIMITDPQQSVTMQGENIPKSVLNTASSGAGVACPKDALCLKTATASFQIADVCNKTICTYTVCGHVQSRDIEITENDILRGNITIVDYTYPQKLDAHSCGATPSP